ncbi:RNA polymerase sigma factor SigF [Nocardia acidivorans]|uniref:RNA polymerase sigma factor SigF n=1 Tax=Nocardia acidivorans TaxID=404580 RepID=UPI0008371571|nr:RNA polymerase sigma factor SigF [Nocardia acidivorans]
MNEAIPSTDGKRTSSSPGDTYDEIEVRFTELAELAPDDPRRSALRAEIIELCLPLAEHIARRFGGRGEEFDDLHQVASVGLVQAVDRFDVTRGSSFLSFAVPTVMGEVKRHFRDNTWAVRVPRSAKELQQRISGAVEVLEQRLRRMPTAREIAAELDVELSDVTQALIARNAYQTTSLDIARGEDDSADSALIATLGAEEPSYRLLENALAVGPLLRELPARERQMLVWRFFENQTQSQIGERLGVSQMQVSRMLSRTLTTLRERALGPVELARSA